MPVRAQRLFAGLAIIWISLLVFACGVSPQAAAPKVCDQASRTELLNARLEPWVVSAPFSLRPPSSAWLQVTTLPSASDGLFGTIAGIAELHSIPAGTSPTVNMNHESMDPAIIVRKVLTWQELSLGAGDWQLYSLSDPGIEVIGCPKS